MVSKAVSVGAALLTLCVLGLLASASSSRVAATLEPLAAPLAEAAPPPLGVTLTAFEGRPEGGCETARRQIRFEVITSDPQTDPVMVPPARVCLAVYRSGL